MDQVVKYRKFKKHYKYQLTENYATDLFYCFPNVYSDFIMLEGREIILKAGYVWDGPSGPAVDTENIMEGSLVHDALYQCIREGWISKEYRLEADLEFKEINLKNGMSPFRAWYTYWAVRIFGRFAVRDT